jgi:hypothetical protein
MFPMQAIGLVRSPYTETALIPRELGARHDAEGRTCSENAGSALTPTA